MCGRKTALLTRRGLSNIHGPSKDREGRPTNIKAYENRIQAADGKIQFRNDKPGTTSINVDNRTRSITRRRQ